MLDPAVQILRQMIGDRLEERQKAERRHIVRQRAGEGKHVIACVGRVGRKQVGVRGDNAGAFIELMDACTALTAVNQDNGIMRGQLDIRPVNIFLGFIGSGWNADRFAEFQSAFRGGAKVCAHAADVSVCHAGKALVVLLQKRFGGFPHGVIAVGCVGKLLFQGGYLFRRFTAQLRGGLYGKKHEKQRKRRNASGHIGDRFAAYAVICRYVARTGEVAVRVAGQADAAASLFVDETDGFQRIQAVSALADDDDHVAGREIMLARHKLEGGDQLDLAAEAAADKLACAERSVCRGAAGNDPDVLIAAGNKLVYKRLCQLGAAGDIIPDKRRAGCDVIQHGLFVLVVHFASPLHFA